MSLGRRIFYNTLTQTLGKVFATLIGIITVALLSQHLQEKGFGQYSTVVAFMGLFGIMADWGLYLFVVREISKPGSDHPKILSNALGLRLTTALVFLLLGAGLAFFLPYEPVVKKTMFVGVAAFLFVSLNQVLLGIFQKHLVQHLAVFAETIGRAINLALVYLFIQGSWSLPFFMLALVAGNAAHFLLVLVLARRYERFGIEFNPSVWKNILANTWPLVFAVILNLLYFKTDTIILSLFHSQEAVGIYSLPYKILEGLLAFPAMFVGLVMPVLSRTASVAWGEFRQVLQRAFDALLLLGIMIVVTTYFYAGPVIDLLKGKREYLDSPNLLRILILSAATIFLGTLFGYAVVAINKQKAMIKGYLSGAIVGLVLYFLLIPRFSYWGAAWATLATEVVVASYAYYLVRQGSGQKISLRILPQATPAILALVLFYKFLSFQWITQIFFGVLLYIGVLLLFRAVPMQFVRELIKRK